MSYQLSHATIFNCLVLTTKAIIASFDGIVKVSLKIFPFYRFFFTFPRAREASGAREC